MIDEDFDDISREIEELRRYDAHQAWLDEWIAENFAN